MSSSVGMIVPNIWKNAIHVPNDQPVHHFCYLKSETAMKEGKTVCPVCHVNAPFIFFWERQSDYTIWYADSFLLKLAYLVRSIYLPNMMVFHGYVRNCQVWFTTQTTPGFSIEMSCHIWPTKGFYMALGNFHAQASHRPRLPHWHSPPPATPRRNVASAAPEPSATRRTSRRRWWRRSTSFPHRGWGKAIVNF